MDSSVQNAKKRYAAEYRERNRERIREYQRAWRKKNPDKVKATQARFWAKKINEFEAEETEVNHEAKT